MYSNVDSVLLVRLGIYIMPVNTCSRVEVARTTFCQVLQFISDAKCLDGKYSKDGFKEKHFQAYYINHLKYFTMFGIFKILFEVATCTI